LIITVFTIAFYAIADFFLFTFTLVFTYTTFFPPTVPSVLTFVGSAAFLTSLLTIIAVRKLQVLPGIGRPSPERVYFGSGEGMHLDQRQHGTRYNCTQILHAVFS
jgi:hypothetical protein